MIEIKFQEENKIYRFDRPISGFDILKEDNISNKSEIIAIKVNDELYDLNRLIEKNAEIKFITWDDEEGKEIFWHTSAHLLAHAIQELYPGTNFGVGPAIENGFYYDVKLPDNKIISENDFQTIENKMYELIKEKIDIKRKEITKDEAKEIFSLRNDKLKLELLDEINEEVVTVYKQGNFIDLCRGPHLPNTGYIKSIKILAVSGAYWKGDIKREQLTRIYGISFPEKKMLDEYLKLLEEAKKRDHRKIGKELEYFIITPNVGIGLPIWLPRGEIVRYNLEQFLRKIQEKYGYQTVRTPHIGNKNLYITSGHYEKYKDSSFTPFSTPHLDEEYMLKPMNCPHHCEIYKSKPRSYKELPLRLAEFGTVYRYEQSGELHGLTRVRSFTQDDAHIFCTPSQLKEEFLKVLEIILYVFKTFNFKEYTAQISLRDPKNKEKYIGNEESWAIAENAIISAVEEVNIKAKKALGEAAFYGPKFDFIVKDCLGRKWQLSTIQIDYNLPERFQLEYIDENNSPARPVMIHRAIFGSFERFIALLLEHTEGKLPFWLAPEQVVVIPVSEKHYDYSDEVANFIKEYNFRVFVDKRNERVGRKIRDAELKHIPVMIILGDREKNEKMVSVRLHTQGDIGSMSLDDVKTFLLKKLEI